MIMIMTMMMVIIIIIIIIGFDSVHSTGHTVQDEA